MVSDIVGLIAFEFEVVNLRDTTPFVTNIDCN